MSIYTVGPLRNPANVTIISRSIGVPVRGNQMGSAGRLHDDVLHIPPSQQRTGKIKPNHLNTTFIVIEIKHVVCCNKIIMLNSLIKNELYNTLYDVKKLCITLPPKSER